jgi:ring-1,2-phenylacetyl-CoA epoxidase subunit PaaE
MATFTPLTVKDKTQTTADCAVLSFEVPTSLQEAFAYEAGQYLTLKAQVKGEELRRSYSLCSSPLDGEWKVAIKQIEDGRFSTYANQVLQPGDEIDVLPPNGRFYVPLDADAERNYVAFAAGSGITPVLSILKTHLKAEPKSHFKLFYVNRTVQSIILREEIEALKNQYLDRLEVYHFLTREERDTPLFNGRIDEEKLATLYQIFLASEETDHYFICGPEQMIFLVRDFLQQKGVDAKQIHFELFGTPTGKDHQEKKTRQTDGSLTTVKVISNGTTITFDMPKAGGKLLDAALAENVDLPFACKGGVCCTCRAKLLEGEVDMEVNYALEQDEVDAGYILTCQSIPLSEKVVVDYDQ